VTHSTNVIGKLSLFKSAGKDEKRNEVENKKEETTAITDMGIQT
jgi:hypothetical protein